MKTLFKSPVFAAFVALFLTFPLSGCFEEEGSKTASQGDGASSSIFQTTKDGAPDSNGIVAFRLPKGVREVGVTYESFERIDELLPRIKKELADAGVTVTSVGRAGPDVGIGVDVLKEDVVVKINTTGIVLLKPYKRSGPAFQWVAIEGFVSK